MATRRFSGLAATIATAAWLSSLTPDGIALRPAPAAAFPPCMTPQGYLIICCPKPACTLLASISSALNIICWHLKVLHWTVSKRFTVIRRRWLSAEG